MTFPRKLLAPGEEIVLESRPHWSVLVPRGFMLAVVLAGCIAVVVLFGSAPIWVGYILATVCLVAVVAFLAKLAAWRAASLVVTTSRVVYRSGVVRRTGREIPINRIQDVTFRQSLAERVLGAGALTIESAGEGGQEPFPDIRRPARVQSLISQLVSLQLQG
ncbi:MAG: PH domain-containing protein, partial [Actinomycetota bacterium]|nr:PH domain-containing protein [Actinomycetota bacterium]